ncbi:GNAT family N-acetyltransferase [Mesorhizobium sp. M0142]|uniref:hypothetical protein n=1 Tax=Mesorhizobium sp. M0142 TaxID=2956894 RepID=UPI003335B817
MGALGYDVRAGSSPFSVGAASGLCFERIHERASDEMRHQVPLWLYENVPIGRIPLITHQTERLILTPIQRGYEAELFKLHNDPLVQKAIFNDVPQTIGHVHEWLDRYSAQ